MSNTTASYPTTWDQFDSNNIGKASSVFHPVTITAASTMTVDGYVIPKLTVDDIVTAYNTVVSGNTCVVSDPSGNMHFTVNQADAIGEDINIEISYFGSRVITYLVEGSTVITTMSGVAHSVPYASGTTPTADEFNALIDALLDAKLLDE